MTDNRRLDSYRVRSDAAEMAKDRVHPVHKANGDEQKYASAHYAMSFTKGLEHDKNTGLVSDPAEFEAFRYCIDLGQIEDFTTRVPVPARGKRRKWEAPTAGVVFDLQGPDAQAVTMAPAPALGSAELDFEMAEVYELALLRDVAFQDFGENAGAGKAAVDIAVTNLNGMEYVKSKFDNRTRLTNGGKLSSQTVFRGSSPGVGNGPYLSQFMLIGNVDAANSNAATDGKINFGIQQIDQKVLPPPKEDDYMMKEVDWLNVQNGHDVNGSGPGQELKAPRRFIHTPRDLATYVHFDALYQAYLNACLILLSNKTPFDPSFAELSGPGGFSVLTNSTASANTKTETTTTGFALYGGPHILTLVTEVATRALKAVRYQKFNNHLRLRPEALAGRIHFSKKIDGDFKSTCKAFTKMRGKLKNTLPAIEDYNLNHPRGLAKTAFLPMAFKEGSPMHPSYGAGHATVAGACVTVLKAFFDTSALFGRIWDADKKKHIPGFYGKAQRDKADKAKAPKGVSSDFVYYETINDGAKLKDYATDCPLTLEGELNKLAANISIGRNMAGVHFYSDYYDSLRMGEQIAIGMLEEQALCYPTDPFVMSVPTFDGDLVRIGRR